MSISKELLSEVLNRDIGEVNNNGNNVEIYPKEGIARSIINIHELAHKCKEWARDNKYNTFTSFTYESMRWLDGKKEWICRIDTGSREDDFFADTEPEAIFQACEWILETVSTDTKGEEDVCSNNGSK